MTLILAIGASPYLQHILTTAHDTGHGPATHLACRDDFSVGPLAPLNPLEKFAALRASHWTPRARPRVQSVWIDDLVKWQNAVNAAERVEVWAGTSVNEVLFTFALGSAIAEGLVQPRLLHHLRVLGQGGGGSIYTSSVADIVNDLPGQPVSDTTIAVWAQGWDAVSAPDPATLNDLLVHATGDRWIDRALRAFANQFPDPVTGLTAHEAALLGQMTEDWQSVPRIIGTVLGMLPLWGSIGDGILMDWLTAFAQPIHGPPLVEITGAAGRGLRGREARITNHGMACLAGRANRLACNGMVRSIGGITINTDAGRVWCRSAGQVRLVE